MRTYEIVAEPLAVAGLLRAIGIDPIWDTHRFTVLGENRCAFRSRRSIATIRWLLVRRLARHSAICWPLVRTLREI